jgi:hypothetical protein
MENSGKALNTYFESTGFHRTVVAQYTGFIMGWSTGGRGILSLRCFQTADGARPADTGE